MGAQQPPGAVEPGMMIRHKPGRTISEADNTWLILLTDQHYAHLRDQT